jgi:pimeloyl-ACP methyl ester carboxylesterase
MGGRRARPRSSLCCASSSATFTPSPLICREWGRRAALDPTRIPRHARDAYVAAYARPDALRTGFEWYRAFEQDAKDNIESKATAVPIPTLCIRGSREPGRLEDYVRGLRDAGFARARGEGIDDCGHFSPDEQPAALAAALRRFTIETSRAG